MCSKEVGQDMFDSRPLMWLTEWEARKAVEQMTFSEHLAAYAEEAEVVVRLIGMEPHSRIALAVCGRMLAAVGDALHDIADSIQEANEDAKNFDGKQLAEFDRVYEAAVEARRQFYCDGEYSGEDSWLLRYCERYFREHDEAAEGGS